MKTLLPIVLLITLASLSHGEPAAAKKVESTPQPKETKTAKAEPPTEKAASTPAAAQRDPAAEKRAQAAIARAKQGR